jgi:pimeloyl-ACP methyl ester carboxylesterase
VRVDIGGARLFLEVFGQEWVPSDDELAKRPTVIALHGGPGADGAKLRHYAAPLADTARVLVPDQRGHGRSDPGTPETWNLSRWAADVAALCAVLDIERPIVLGVSFGGFVAQRYASDYPEHPAGLVLVSTEPRLPAEEDLVERFLAVGGAGAAEIMRRDIDEATEESGAEWERVCGPLLCLNPRGDPDHDRLEALRIRTPEVNLHFFRGEGRAMDLRADLARVRCPTLVLVGERDPLIPAALAQEIIDAIRGDLAKLIPVPDASHEVLVDNPAVAYGAIREFLRQHESSRSR